MGIHHFETIVEMTPNCSRGVYIKELADKYAARTGKKPVMVIDGNYLMKHFYVKKEGNFDFVCGGQTKRFIYFMKNFWNILKELNIEPVVYFDGPTVPAKMFAREDRNKNKAKAINKVFAKRSDFNNRAVFPLLLSVVGRFIFKYEYNCRVRVSTNECDRELAEYAHKESCFAILSQDTDFLCSKNAVYYFSIKHLEFFNDQLPTKLYDRWSVLKHYAMTEQQMWLFGSLSSTESILSLNLKHFHETISLRNRHLRTDENNGDKVSSTAYKFEEVAKFVTNITKECPNDVEQAVPDVIKHFKELKICINEDELIECLHSYQPCELESWVTDENIQGPWLDILELAYKRHIECDAIPDVYGTLVGLPYEIGQFLEKPESSNLESSRLFLPLRQRIYSVLLHEKPNADNGPHLVKEFGMWSGKWHGLNNMEEVYVPELRKDCFHPGLIALWTKDSQRINLHRWTLFAKTIDPDLDPAVFYRLNYHHVVPVAVLLYLLNPNAQKMQKQNHLPSQPARLYGIQIFWQSLTRWFSLRLQLWFPIYQKKSSIPAKENLQEHTELPSEEERLQEWRPTGYQQANFQHQPGVDFAQHPFSSNVVHASERPNKKNESYLMKYEIDSFIKQAVTISSLKPEDMYKDSLLRKGIITKRTINTSTVMGYGISMVLFLMSALGFPLEKAMPWHYFDGPLFHYFLTKGESKVPAYVEFPRQLIELSRDLSKDVLRITEDFQTLERIVNTKVS